MIGRYEIISNNEPVVVEITDDKELIFIDYDIEYDYSMLEFGEPPTVACLLGYLWSADDCDLAIEEVAIYDHRFPFNDEWYSLGDVGARIVLALSFSDPQKSINVAVRGSGFTIDQRIKIVEGVGESKPTAIFLSTYDDNDFSRDRRLGLEYLLEPEDKCWLAIHGFSSLYGKNDKLRLVRESTDDCRLRVLESDDIGELTYAQEKMILKSIEDEWILSQALCAVQGLDGYEITGIAMRRIKDPDARANVGKYSGVLSDQQRETLLGRKLNVLR